VDPVSVDPQAVNAEPAVKAATTANDLLLIVRELGRSI
jgi:hypothetical protein